MQIQPMPDNCAGNEYTASFYPGDGAYYNVTMNTIYAVKNLVVYSAIMPTYFNELFEERSTNDEPFARDLASLLKYNDTISDFDLDELNKRTNG